MKFLEAMAAVVDGENDGRVQFRLDGSTSWVDWVTTDPHDQIEQTTTRRLYDLAKAEWRLGARLSRVEELAKSRFSQSGLRAEFAEEDYTYALRVACEWLENECQHGEDSATEYARVLRRRFLEPR